MLYRDYQQINPQENKHGNLKIILPPSVELVETNGGMGCGYLNLSSPILGLDTVASLPLDQRTGSCLPRRLSLSKPAWVRIIPYINHPRA
jgi:hypothetical protein